MPGFWTDEHGLIYVPRWVVGEASFRKWQASDEFPKGVPITFERGDVRVDLTGGRPVRRPGPPRRPSAGESG